MSEKVIIKFPSNKRSLKASNRLSAKPKRMPSYCRHPQVLVCEKTRMLECEKCGKVVDPYDYLWDWAIQEKNVEWEVTHLKAEIKRLTQELAALKKDERNTRSRLKRLKK